MFLFKYLSPDAVAHVLEHEGEVAVRFALPNSFNDPYELFLRTDKALESEEAMAFYDHFVRDIPQLPVTCFSKHPQSIVMWAHYGCDGKGICLGFDEQTLADSFPVAYLEDVSYSEESAKIHSSLVEYALATGKKRHTLRLIAVAERAAYFTKRLDWRYECERRLVVDDNGVQKDGGNLIARVPSATLRYIILGQNVSDALRQHCEAYALAAGVPTLQVRIGKRSFEPFFSTGDLHLRWNGTDFDTVLSICAECGQLDTSASNGRCRWCSISEETRCTSPMRSLLSATLHYGIDKAIPINFDGLSPRGYLAKARAVATETKSQRRETKAADFDF